MRYADGSPLEAAMHFFFGLTLSFFFWLAGCHFAERKALTGPLR
jgi:hypothetical protein